MPAAQEFFRVGMPMFAMFVALEFVILWRQRCALKEGVSLLAIKTPTAVTAERQAGRLT
jgi:hypothetical protein